MIPHNLIFEKSFSNFFSVFNVLHFNRAFNLSNFSKSKGIDVFKLFFDLFSICFENISLITAISNHKLLFSKNSYYRFLENPNFNWRKFLYFISLRLIKLFNFDSSCDEDACNVLIIDDTVINKSCSSKTELLAKIFNHVDNKFVKGFYLLTLAFSNGFSTFVVDFSLLSSANDVNRYQPLNDNVDKRSVSYKRASEAIVKKTYATISLIKNAVSNGINASYVLFDSWFTSNSMLKDVLDLDLDVVCRLKHIKQYFIFNSKYYDLDTLFRISKDRSYFYTDKKGNNFYLSEIEVKTKNNIKIKLVFSRKKKDSNEFITILSTDTSISNNEIIRIYGIRWNIETLFKYAKGLFKLGKEFQAKSYNLLVAHTTIVFVRYIVILYLSQGDAYSIKNKTSINQCYFDFVQVVKYADVASSIEILLCLINCMMSFSCEQIKNIIYCQVRYLISSLPYNFSYLNEFFNWET